MNPKLLLGLAYIVWLSLMAAIAFVPGLEFLWLYGVALLFFIGFPAWCYKERHLLAEDKPGIIAAFVVGLMVVGSSALEWRYPDHPVLRHADLACLFCGFPVWEWTRSVIASCMTPAKAASSVR
jgi:hypothetical protein